MSKDIVPVQSDGEYETHPAFGSVSIHRVSSTPGAVLFDSDVQHGHYVVVRVDRADRERSLNRDWIHHPDVGKIVEFAMSEAQWASLISSVNTSGVPCTLTRTEKDGALPRLALDQRLAISMKETREAADRAFGVIKEARDTYEAHKTAANLRNLHYAIENATANVTYAGESLAKHAEDVVQRSRADIEAMMVAAAEQAGVAPPRYTPIDQIQSAPALEEAKSDVPATDQS